MGGDPPQVHRVRAAPLLPSPHRAPPAGSPSREASPAKPNSLGFAPPARRTGLTAADAAARGCGQEPFVEVTECAAFKQGSALLIVANFVLNIVQYEILPDPGTVLFLLFDRLDMAFTIVTNPTPIAPISGIIATT